MSLKSEWSDAPDLTRRFIGLSLFAALFFLLLILRLWYLQAINVDRFQALSEKNRIRYMPISAPRGPVFDRDGELLVDNRPAFGVSVMRQEVEDKERLLDNLVVYLGSDRADLEKRWAAGSRFPYYRPVPLASDVNRDVLEKVQENALDLPGVLIEVHPLRSYPAEDLAAHLFGYLGEITEAELRSSAFEDYRSGDYVGQTGIERSLESYLRGREGQRLVEVDVKGKELRVLKVQEPVPGNKVFLSIDKDLQLAAQKAIGDQAGSAVAIDVHTGEVLAMVSRPSFNPAAFARGITGTEWIELLQNPRHPLQNKAIKGQYPPASTFKIVTALAALRAGTASSGTRVDCQGSIKVGNREFRCWKKWGHGLTDLKKAIRESCDVWFYKVGLELGIDRLSDMARELGLGEKLGFILEGEKGGLVPSRSWKRQRFGAPWYDGETAIAAIGQGFMLATPLQLAAMTAAVANGGKVLRPQVVQRIEGWDGTILKQMEPEVLHHVDFGAGNLEIVQDALAAVVNDPHGTGRASRLDEVRVAGKTGTAQVVRRKDDESEQEDGSTPYKFRDHALFVAYAPAEDPQIAVSVVIEHGEHGSSTAAPVARAILEAYFGIGLESGPVPDGTTGD